MYSYFSTQAVGAQNYFIQSDCINSIQKLKVDFLKKRQCIMLRTFGNVVDTTFGDVMCFDTTFNTNKYKLLCAPIVGINNHGHTTKLI